MTSGNDSIVNGSMRESRFSATEQELLEALHVPVSSNEYRRIQALRDTRILDTNTMEEKFQRLTSMAARIFQTPIALVSLVDLKRLWLKSRVGFPVCETTRDHCLCNYVVIEDAPPVFVVPDAKIVEEYNLSPFIHGPPYIRFYAAAPLFSCGQKIGTFCLIDQEPHYDFDANKQKCLADFAYFATELIELHRVQANEAERDLPKLSATLLQHLRNPLASVNNQFQQLHNQLGNDSFLCFSSRSNSNQEELQVIMSKFREAVDQLTSALEVSLKLGITLAHDASEISVISPRTIVENKRALSLHSYMMELKRATSLVSFLGQSLHWSLQYDEENKGKTGSTAVVEIVPQREIELLATLINFLSLKFLAPTNINDNNSNEYHQSVYLTCHPVGAHLGELSVELSFPIMKLNCPVSINSSSAKSKFLFSSSTSEEEYDLSFLEEVLRTVRGHLIVDDSCYHRDTAQGRILIHRMKIVVPCYLLSFRFPSYDDGNIVCGSACSSRPLTP